MSGKYRAMQVTEPGRFELVERDVPAPGSGQVRIRVEAAGICHTDCFVVDGLKAGISYPRVPGHEIAGRIEAIGPDVHGWDVGQRVGVGWFGGQCGHCEPCKRGDLVNCLNIIITGHTTDGGYAEIAIAEARSLALVPDELNSLEAAPLLCAGVTSFNALRNSHLRAGDTVAIHGIGGLGHLAIQFARHMGFRTVAIARGEEKEALALKLGAHSYIDSAAVDAAEALLALGGADAILTTVSNGKAMSSLLGGLSNRGRLIIVGLSEDPVLVSNEELVRGSKTIAGELTGTAIDEDDTLDFSALQGIQPMIEVVALEQAPDAYQKMMRNEARFRMVIQMSPNAGEQ